MPMFCINKTRAAVSCLAILFSLSALAVPVAAAIGIPDPGSSSSSEASGSSQSQDADPAGDLPVILPDTAQDGGQSQDSSILPIPDIQNDTPEISAPADGSGLPSSGGLMTTIVAASAAAGMMLFSSAFVFRTRQRD